MPSFRFGLQKLLNLKMQMEKNVQNELGIALQKMERQKTILAQIQSQISFHEAQYRSRSMEKTTLSQLKQSIEYIYIMRKKEAEQKERVNEEKRNVDKIRERLIELMKEKKILERLREKELILFKKEQERTARIMVDELTSFNEATKTEGKLS